MNLNRHGIYKINVLDDGQIVLVDFIGRWNELTIQDFFDEIKNLPLAARWVALGNMTGFDGWTPQADEAYQRVVKWGLEHGEAGVALVLGSDVKKMFTTRSEKQRAAEVPTGHFSDLDAAMEWCRELLKRI